MVFKLQYFIIVLLLFVVLLIGGILGFVFHGQAENKLKMGMLSSLKDYGKIKAITTGWDETQRAVS